MIKWDWLLLESIFEEAIPSILQQLGLGQVSMYGQGLKIGYGEGHVLAEFDFIIVTRDRTLLLMEVQNVVGKDDIKHLNNKLEDMVKNREKYKYFHEIYMSICDRLYGVIGGFTFHENTKTTADKCGIILAKYSMEGNIIVEKPRKIRNWWE